MRTWLIAAVSVLVGAAMGVGLSIARIHQRPWDGTPNGLNEGDRVAQVEPGGPHPKAVPNETSFDFGVMDTDTHGKHDFIITNYGDATLTLQKGDTSCKCTLADLDKTVLRPGESAKVTVEWHTKGFLGPYRQTAAVLTNDPTRHRLALTISGRVVAIVRPIPDELALSSLPSTSPHTATVNVFCYKPYPFQITGHEFSDPATAEAFEVQIEPMPKDQVQAESGASSGQIVHVTVKPGLPLGPFQQTITLKTNLPGDRTIAIPVKGTVVGDIRVVGPAGWDSNTNTLYLGTLGSQEEVQRNLMIFVRGSDAKNIQVEIGRREPEFLQATLGNRITAGDLTRIPLTIRIPKGGEPMDYSGTESAKPGQIVLKTSHPLAKELSIKVRFAIRK